MMKNHLKIAIRNISKNRLFSFINIAGLAIGMACAILIGKWVQNELSYDSYVKGSDSIFRVNWSYKWNGGEGVGATTPPPLAAKLCAEVSGVVASTRIYPVSSMIGRYRDKFFSEEKVFGADSNFFEIFNFMLLAGDPRTVLSSPNSVILTESEAKKYFGGESPIGQMISLGDQKWEINKLYDNTFRVTGIVQDPPGNSHFQFGMLTSMSSYPSVSYFNWSWIWMQVVTYAKMRNDASVTAIESQVQQIVAKYAPAAFHRVGFSYDDLIRSGGRWDFVFQPLKDVYLGSAQIGNPLGPVGNRSYVGAFSLIAIFILLIACINFMNLSTARSEKRSREVGVRKTLGSSRNSLFAQFMTESVVYSLIALFIALFLVELLTLPFNSLAGKSLNMGLFDPPWQIPALLCLTLFVGTVAGIYPGIYLSSFRPVQVLKPGAGSGAGGRRFRSVLTIFQFMMSVGLIVCTLLVRQQLDFMKKADLGFGKENVIVISNANNPLGQQLDAFTEKIRTYVQIVDASVTTGIPPNFGHADYYKVPGKGDEQRMLMSYLTDENFMRTMGIRLEQGRGFQKEYPTDAKSIIVNETAVKQFGIRDPIGKTIDYPSQGKYTIIGVMRDFNFMDLHSPILPFALFERTSNSYQTPDSYILVRVKGQNLAGDVSLLESTWNSFTVKTPFQYSFLDQNLEQQYTSERNLGRIFLVFSLLAIFIACLGLLGLAAFVTEHRTKEIGVRQILGASMSQIVFLLSKEFGKWVLAANLIAWPLAYLVMNKWLDDFAYRIEIGWWVFALAGGISLLIALLTVSTQAIKAALANPVESLHYE
jgi:putative ABC transport system permease protein